MAETFKGKDAGSHWPEKKMYDHISKITRAKKAGIRVPA
jgi:hypothetical protein